MADLSQIDLDGGSEPAGSLQAHEQTVSVSSSGSEDSGHSKSEDLHLYFRQGWKKRLGMTGIVITAFFFITLCMTFALLVFSYTGIGRSFLQGLKFFIF